MSILDGMKLPQVNLFGELEQLSKDRLRAILPIELFEIRDVPQDKGIDWEIELKYNGVHTNFSAILQLKANYQSSRNKDGSYSIQLDTYNIQYLLNSPKPGFYIVYLKDINQLYYKELDEYHKQLYLKDSNWASQASHTLRLTQILDESTVSRLYNLIHDKCQYQRKLRDDAIITSSLVSKTVEHPNSKEISSSGLNSDIINNIEKAGFHLISNGRSLDLLNEAEKLSIHTIEASALFWLILGIASFSTARIFDALKYLSKANRLRAELPSDLIDHLCYFETVTKHTAGILNRKQYDKSITSLIQSSIPGLYIRIEKAKAKYFSVIKNNNQKKEFLHEINQILLHPRANSNIKLIARIEILNIEGHEINKKYTRSIALFNTKEEKTGYASPQRVYTILEFDNEWQTWNNQGQRIQQDAINLDNEFALNLCKFVILDNIFEREVNYTYFTKEGLFLPPYYKLSLDVLLPDIANVITSYQQVGHTSNVCAILALKYRILHFLKRYEEAQKVVEQMLDLVESHGLEDDKRKLLWITKGNTYHEKLEKEFSIMMATKLEAKYLIEEMSRMDEEEGKTGVHSDNTIIYNHIIELFPIKHFAFPADKLDLFFKILGITSKKFKKELKANFENFIPVLNICRTPISQEGYLGGLEEHRGIESVRNFHEIRSAFYKAGFTRYYLIEEEEY